MARATGFGTQSTGAGALNAAYRFADRFRVGAYLDYQAFQGNPFGVNLGAGGVQQGYNNPTFGGYVGFSERPDETGVQAKASGGYNPGSVNITRAILAGTEPGFGTAGLNAYYAFGIIEYGINIDNKMILTPYASIQYTDMTRSGYVEQANIATTIYPLAYNSYFERLVTGTFGAKMKGMITESIGYRAAMGAQIDFSRNAAAYDGASYVDGMQYFAIGHGGSWNGVRPAGMAGLFYDPMPNHRISVIGYASQQAWTQRTYTSGLLSYQIAF